MHIILLTFNIIITDTFTITLTTKAYFLDAETSRCTSGTGDENEWQSVKESYHWVCEMGSREKIIWLN